MRYVMQKRVLFCCLFIFSLIAGYAGVALSTDAGPENMTLKSSDSTKKAPSVFPHKAHQELMECGACHHGMADGKQTPYTEGMAIQKCEECHNPEVLGGRKKDKLDLDTFKGAGHGNCLECHKEVAKKDDSKKSLKSCKTCHEK